MIDDTTLLRRYAAERAEDAFAEFVRRQLPFVYSAALRRLGGDTHRAEDVAQVVFSAAARDAHRLSQHASLAGWLYTATRNAVIDVMRVEKRRHTREEAYTMQTILGDIESPADWSRLSPVLDAAMDELSSADREAVLLRFFQGRPFNEIGAGLGLSEDTARKRVERALDKLRTRLRRHGIGSTSAALATFLTTETVCGAPSGLVVSITGAALGSGGATAGAVALMTVSKLQVGLVATIIASGAIGLISQQRTITGLRESTAATQQHLAKLEADNAAFAKARAEADVDVAKLRAELSALQKPGGSVNRQVEATRVAPARAEAAPPIVLGPLPDTAEIRQQKDYWHRRYDPFFQQRGLTTAQGDRFVELKIHQAIAREEFQAAVRASNLRGDSRGVQALRAKDDSPVTRELFEMLGKEGYTAYGTYERTSAYRMSYVEPLMSECAAAMVPLSTRQAEQMLAVFETNARSVWAQPTDIGTTGSMDWDAVVAQAAGILTPAQSAALQAHASRRKPSQRSQ